VESSLAIDKEEFRRGYIHSLSKTRQMSSQEASVTYTRTVQFVHGLTENLARRSQRHNESLQEYFSQADAGLALVKRQLKDHLEKLLSVNLSN
jgi:hypothetical protein